LFRISSVFQINPVFPTTPAGLRQTIIMPDPAALIKLRFGWSPASPNCFPACPTLQFPLVFRRKFMTASGASTHPTIPMSPGDTPGRLGLRAYLDLKQAIHRSLLDKLDPEATPNVPSDQQRTQALAVIRDLVSQLKIPLTDPEKDRISHEIRNEVFSLGPLEPLMQDPSVSDILINGAGEVFVERGGILEETEIVFKDDAHLVRIINKIVSAVGRRVDESSPMVDARLPDGSRVNVILPPLSVDGPHVSIRRFGQTPLTDADLLTNQSLTPPMLGLLKAAVAARLNIVISGGAGAGKTTLLNVLSAYISPKERIITIEDAAELQLKQRHVVRLECRPANTDGQGEVQARQLVINSLRMRPDRIIVGEVRGDEVLDMLQAMNSGHDGSLTTIHANNPRDALARIETMVMTANLNSAEKAIRRQIASAITLILQVARLSDGTRRLTHISEVTGMEADVISMQDLFVFERQGISSDGKMIGTFTATGIRPRFAERLQALGINLPMDMFQPAMSRRR
jgi:pilus assembly protein CpaF